MIIDPSTSLAIIILYGGSFVSMSLGCRSWEVANKPAQPYKNVIRGPSTDALRYKAERGIIMVSNEDAVTRVNDGQS